MVISDVQSSTDGVFDVMRRMTAVGPTNALVELTHATSPAHASAVDADERNLSPLLVFVQSRLIDSQS